MTTQAYALTLLSVLLTASAAFAVPCTTSLKKVENMALTQTEDPYRYADYTGPKNAVLEKVRNTPADQQNPRYATAAAHGKAFTYQEVMSVLQVNFDGHNSDSHWLQVYVNAQDPMTRVTPRAAWVKGSYTFSDPLIRDWVFEQYPELVEPVKKWRIEAGNQNNSIGQKPSAANVEKWINEHPEYKNGILVFPRPTIWNRVPALHKDLSRFVLDGSREFFIETIAALFSPKLVESQFNDLRPLLMKLLGPHSERLSQAGVVERIAQWVLVQYPELKELVLNPNAAIDLDALSFRYGRTLGVIPIAWTSGDMRDIVEAKDLEPMPSHWRTNVLSPLLKFIKGDQVPKVKENKFLVKDPTTGKRRELQSGDEVQLLFTPKGLVFGDLTFANQHVLYGDVHSVIKNKNGEMVGIELRHWVTEGYPGDRVGTQISTHRYWIKDFEAEDSRIIRSTSRSQTVVSFESLSFPKDSGDFMIQVGKGPVQAPISVGDFLSLKLSSEYKPNAYEYGTLHVDMLVTDIPTDAEGQPTGVTGYVNTNYVFQHAEGLDKAADGTPISIQVGVGVGDKRRLETTPLEGGFKIKTFLWSELVRGSEGTSFSAPYDSVKDYFRNPGSPIREKYDGVRAWGRSRSTSAQIHEDSGDYMLAIGNLSRHGASAKGAKIEQAPLSPGDEVLLHVKTKGTPLGFRYDRVLISSFVYENGKTIGFRGENIGSSGKESQWLFSQILKEDSYIETAPWFGARANRFPGAYQKRVPYTPKNFSKRSGFHDFFFGRNKKKKQAEEAQPLEDLFGYSYGAATSVEPWTEKPMLYDKWLETNKIAKQVGVDITWAYWVLQGDSNTPTEALTKTFKKLSLKFHPDRNPNDPEAEEAFKAISTAWTLIQKYHQ